MTVAAIVDRLFRTYLYPPDARPAQAFVKTQLLIGGTSLDLKNFVIPEDEDLMAAGVVIEIGSELIQVTAYDAITLVASGLLRGFMGTTAVQHEVDDPVLLSPPYSRLSVFQAVADNIITLYPRLYTVTTGSVVPVSNGIAALDDVLAVEVVECWENGLSSAVDYDARIVDYHAAVGGRALITNLASGQVWVRYRRRFGDAADETVTLADLGLEERWVNIVMVGAAADMFAGRDLPASETRWVEAVLEAETIPVGTRSQLARQLLQHKEYLITQAQKEMRAEYKAKVHMKTQMRVRSAFG